MSNSSKIFSKVAVLSVFIAFSFIFSLIHYDSGQTGNSSFVLQQAIAEMPKENIEKKKGYYELVETLNDKVKRESLIKKIELLIHLEESDEAVKNNSLKSIFDNFYDRYAAQSFSFYIFAILKTLFIVVIFLIIKKLIRKGMDSLIKVRSSYPNENENFSPKRYKYLITIKKLINIILSITALILILESWNLDIFQIVNTEFGLDVTFSIVTIFFVIIFSILIWTIATLGIDKVLSSAMPDRAGPRIKTLLALAKNILLIVIILVDLIIILSELGINVAPLLAGAGVVGLAIGFGAQTLVKDIITGAFIVFENTLSVGDVVEVAGHSGVVEAMTIRTIRLRDLYGTVHTVPFSSVETIVNMTRDYAYVLAEVGVAYKENTDKVFELLRDVDSDLRADEMYAHDIIGQLEEMGVEKFDDSAVILRVRLKTKPGKQWSIRREFNRRMKIIFDKKGIEMPFPHATIYFGDSASAEDKLQNEK